MDQIRQSDEDKEKREHEDAARKYREAQEDKQNGGDRPEIIIPDYIDEVK